MEWLAGNDSAGDSRPAATQWHWVISVVDAARVNQDRAIAHIG
jgi:hypothetical protein